MAYFYLYSHAPFRKSMFYKVKISKLIYLMLRMILSSILMSLKRIHSPSRVVEKFLPISIIKQSVYESIDGLSSIRQSAISQSTRAFLYEASRLRASFVHRNALMGAHLPSDIHCPLVVSSKLWHKKVQSCMSMGVHQFINFFFCRSLYVEAKKIQLIYLCSASRLNVLVLRQNRVNRSDIIVKCILGGRRVNSLDAVSKMHRGFRAIEYYFKVNFFYDAFC